MKTVQLHDKVSEEIIGSIKITDKNSFDNICNAWDNFQNTYNSDTIDYFDIWDFVSEYPKMDMEVVEVEFYQPSNN